MVMKEAVGGDQFKSACNLVYINEFIKNQIEELPTPVYSQDKANVGRFNMSSGMILKIKDENDKFIADSQ